MSDQRLLCLKDIGHAVENSLVLVCKQQRCIHASAFIKKNGTVTQLDTSIFSRIWPVYVAEQADCALLVNPR